MFRKTTVKSLLDQWRGDLTSNVQRFNQQAKLAREWEAQLYTNRKLVNKAKHDLSQVDRKQVMPPLLPIPVPLHLLPPRTSRNTA